MIQRWFQPVLPQSLGWRHFADAAMLFFGAYGLLIICMDRAINVYDEGIVLVGGSRVANGDVIHRDFYSLYGPAQYYIVAGLFKVFGESVLVERLWDTAVRSVVSVLIYWICIFTSGRRLALLAALMCIPWLAAFRSYGYPVFPALCASLGSLLCMVPVLQGRTEPRFRFASGLCAGLAFLFRYDTGVVVAAVVGGTAAVAAVGSLRPFTRWPAGMMRASAVFLAGVATVAMPLAIAYVALDVVPGFIFDFIRFPAANYAATRSLPFPGLRAIWAVPMEVSVYVPLVTCFAAIIAAPWRAAATAHRKLLVLIVLTTLALYTKGLVRVSALHMAMGIICSFAMLATLLASWPLSRLLPRTLITIALLATLSATYAAIVSAGRTATDNWAWAFATEPPSTSEPGLVAYNGRCRETPGPTSVRCFRALQEDLEAIDYLRANAPAGTRLFVGTGRHDKIFVNDLALYFEAHMQPVTHWHQFDPGLQTSAPIQKDIIRELDAQKPPYIVIDSRFDGVLEPNKSALSSGITILDQYIATKYERAQSFGQIVVWKRALDRAGGS